MRLVKLQLKRSTPFWMLPPITLTSEKPESPFIDVDLLTSEQRDTIEDSKDIGQISILDSDNKRLNSILDSKSKGAYSVNIADVKENYIPEVNSVTVPLDDEEEEPIKEKVVSLEEYYDEARIILNRNGNTVRKMLPQVEDISLLMACEEIEKSESKRTGILKLINTLIGERKNG